MLLVPALVCLLAPLPQQRGVPKVALGPHRGEVTHLAFTENATHLVAASDRGELALWKDAAGRKPVLRVTAQEGAITALDAGARGVGIAFAYADHPGVYLLAADGEEASGPLLADDLTGIIDVAWDPQGQWLWVLHGTSLTRFTPGEEEGKLSLDLELESPPTCLAVGTRGQFLVVAGSDKMLHVVDVPNMKVQGRHGGHEGPVTCIAIDTKGRLALTGSTDNTARVWSANRGRQVRQLNGHGAAITAVAFGQQDQLMASADAKGALKLWTARGYQYLRELRSAGTSPINAMRFTRDGRKLAAATSGGQVTVWDVTGVQESK